MPVEEPVTGGEWADVPAGPPAWNPPEERSPQMTGLAEFADPATALFWPVRTKNQHGRTVCFIDSDKKPVGLEHKGQFTTQGRHFLAPRNSLLWGFLFNGFLPWQKLLSLLGGGMLAGYLGSWISVRESGEET